MAVRRKALTLANSSGYSSAGKTGSTMVVGWTTMMRSMVVVGMVVVGKGEWMGDGGERKHLAAVCGWFNSFRVGEEHRLVKDSRAENSTAVLDRHYHHCDVESRVGHDFGKSATHLHNGFIEGQRQRMKWTEIYMLPRCSCHCLECDNDSLFFAICRPVFRSACFHGQASTPKTNALLMTRGKVCAMQAKPKQKSRLGPTSAKYPTSWRAARDHGGRPPWSASARPAPA